MATRTVGHGQRMAKRLSPYMDEIVRGRFGFTQHTTGLWVPDPARTMPWDVALRDVVVIVNDKDEMTWTNITNVFPKGSDEHNVVIKAHRRTVRDDWKPRVLAGINHHLRMSCFCGILPYVTENNEPDHDNKGILSSLPDSVVNTFPDWTLEVRSIQLDVNALLLPGANKRRRRVDPRQTSMSLMAWFLTVVCGPKYFYLMDRLRVCRRDTLDSMRIAADRHNAVVASSLRGLSQKRIILDTDIDAQTVDTIERNIERLSRQGLKRTSQKKRLGTREYGYLPPAP